MKKMPEAVRQWFEKQGAEGGRKAAANMTRKARQERGRKAIAARWAKQQKKESK